MPFASDCHGLRPLGSIKAPCLVVYVAYAAHNWTSGQLERSRGTYAVRGKAWSGTGPVTDVHVSLTREGDWHPAQLEAPKGPYHWQDWSFQWEASDVGRHTLRARATDAAANVQPEVFRPGTGSATATTRSRCCTSTRADALNET